MAISRRIGVFLIAFIVLFGAVSITGIGSSSLLTATSAAAAGAKLTLSESQKLAVVGQPVKVIVKGEQLTDLYGFEFKLKYDTAKLKFMSASAEWEGMAISPIDKNGVVTFAHTKVGASAKGVSGTNAIATFTFEAAASGKTGIELLEAKLVDSEVKAVQLKSAAKLALLTSMRASRYPLDEGATATFADAEKIPVWAKPSVASAVTHNLLKGRSGNRFEPQQHATRAETVTIVLSLVDALYK
ncbi:cohesin domain-containing protein [Paenibacillus sp. LHD-38]|uniref:cohesin domain-containing protein n=1 Tax=Paenibacillus sp. LHD-38 TaxID=3072143 RepID=UPI00280C961D|nr:S-layer homology domain-containing protein [Paenibacillus sp. LHD-38]MDQ8735216.1 S-layer homology domain-containing protein [Paenibacillus sp. LHD-38]